MTRLMVAAGFVVGSSPGGSAERAMVNVKIAAETWDPRKLPAVSEPERIKPAEIIMEVVFTLGAVLVLNFYPQIIRIAFFNHGQWTFMPVLSDAFFRYLPWINAACLHG